MKKLAWALGGIGVIVLFGGLLTHGLGLNAALPVSQPELVVWGTNMIGIIFITSAFWILTGRDKQVKIAEKDERNIAIRNDAGATAFWSMLCLLGLTLFILMMIGSINGVSCLALLAVYLLSMLIYAFRLSYLHKRM